MSKEVPGKAEVLVIHHPEGVKHACKQCKRVHLEGEYAVGLLIVENGKTYRYAIGIRPPIWCCGEQKPFFRLFDEKEDAESLCAEVQKHLNDHGTTYGLPLIGLYARGN